MCCDNANVYKKKKEKNVIYVMYANFQLWYYNSMFK